MKKVIVLLIVIGIGLILARGWKKDREQKKANDLKKIEQVQAACEKVVRSRVLFTTGSDLHTWYIFELGLIFENENDALNFMKEELGDDFSVKLSNGDRLFVGFHQHLQEYRIYAGQPNRDEDMIYPRWNYKKVKPEE